MDLEQKRSMTIAKILNSLPAKFDHLRTAWYAVPRAEQNIERLTDHLVNKELLVKLKQSGENNNITSGSAYEASSSKTRKRQTGNKDD